jgi:hypothetical protein
MLWNKSIQQAFQGLIEVCYQKPPHYHDYAIVKFEPECSSPPFDPSTLTVVYMVGVQVLAIDQESHERAHLRVIK